MYVFLPPFTRGNECGVISYCILPELNRVLSLGRCIVLKCKVAQSPFLGLLPDHMKSDFVLFCLSVRSILWGVLSVTNVKLKDSWEMSSCQVGSATDSYSHRRPQNWGISQLHVPSSGALVSLEFCLDSI